MPASPPTQVDQSFDLYARMVCRALGVSTAAVMFVEGDHLVIPGAVGLPDSLSAGREVPMSDSLCEYVVRGWEPVLITDVRAVETGERSLLEVELGIRAYAGWPITDHRSRVVGSVCAIDTVPRAWSAADSDALSDVAAACSAEIAQRELRRVARADERAAVQRAERGQLLLALSEALMAPTTLVEIAVAVDQLAVEQLGCRRAALYFVGDDSHEGANSSPRCLELVRTPGYAGSVESAYDAFDVDDTNPVGHACLLQEALFFSDRDEQDRRYPEVAATVRFGSARAFLPLTLIGAPLGILAMGWPEPRTLDWMERATLGALSAYTAQAVHRAVLLRERAHTSLTLQQAMLTDLPAPRGLELVARYRPASTTEQVGGDWYDALVLPGGGTKVACGDVVGHDIAAAATMGQVRSALRAFAWAVDDGPAGTVTQLDEAMAGLGIDALATLVCAHIDRTGDHDVPWCVTWTSAGHPPPVLLGPDGEVRSLAASQQDLLLGVLPGEPRHDHRVGVRAGSTLLLFTDGLIERRGESIDVGLRRLHRALAGVQDREPADLVDRLLTDVLSDDLDDDVAVLAVRFGEP